MRVTVPHTNLNPVVRQVLSSYGLPVTYVDVSGDEDAYRRLLKLQWVIKETVVIVEHDILPWPGAIEELFACPGLWCTYSYRMLGGIGIAHALGCAKLSAGLMDKLPGVWDEAGRWDKLDQRLLRAAAGAGVEPHLHRPPVIHLPTNPAH